MKLTVVDLLGISEAEVTLAPGKVLEVIGPNASGKTSLAVCAQAVLARDANPLGLAAVDAKKAYLHNGSTDGAAILQVDGEEGVSWQPKSATIVAPAGEPVSTPHAVGMIDFTARMKAQERAKVFQAVLLPPIDEIMAAVSERLSKYLPEDDLKGALDMISERGWEATESVYSDRARQSKREWQALTGANYGVRIATDWRPDGWEADFDAMTVQQAEEGVVDARDALQALHRVQAVSEAELEAAEQAAAALPALIRQADEISKGIETKRQDIAALSLNEADRQERKSHASLNSARDFLLSSPFVECPHCGGKLQTTPEGLATFDEARHEERRAKAEAALPDLEREAQTAAATYRELQADNARMGGELHQMRNDYSDVQAEIRLTKTASEKTGELDTPERRSAIAEAEQAVEDAQTVVKMVSAEARAQRLQQTIVRYVEIAKAVGPQGIRATMLAKGLASLNAGLKVLSAEASWPVVSVAENGAVSYGDRPVLLCSESERWRAQACIQLTLAALTGSKAVVLDRADLLDAANRGGLIRAISRVVEKVGVAVLICATEGPDLSTASGWPQIRIAEGKTA